MRTDIGIREAGGPQWSALRTLRDMACRSPPQATRALGRHAKWTDGRTGQLSSVGHTHVPTVSVAALSRPVAMRYESLIFLSFCSDRQHRTGAVVVVAGDDSEPAQSVLN